MSARSIRVASGLTLPLAIALSVRCASTAAAQAPSSDWHSVEALPSQTLVRITASGNTATCFIDSVSDDRIACSSQSSHSGTHNEFARDQVTTVRLTGHFSGGAAVITAAAFTAAGAGIGATQTKGFSTPAKPIGVGAAGGLGVGVIAGALVARAAGKSHGTIIYRRP